MALAPRSAVPLRSAVAALLCAFACALAPHAARADVPPLLIPGGADSATVDPPAAPLIVPGRVTPGTPQPPSARKRAQDAYLMGRGLERQMQPAAAIAAYRRAVQADPKIPDAHLRMARLFMSVGQHRIAAREFAAELRIDSTNVAARRELGLALASAGDTLRAIVQLEKLVHRDDRDEPSWQALGYAYGLAGRNEDAVRALQRALALAPKDADAWRDLGAVYATLGRAAEAREAYTKATTLDPHDSATLLNLGNLERREHRLPEALAAYTRATKVDSLQSFAWRGRIAVLREMDRAADAAETYRQWLRVRPHAEDARAEAMALYTELGRSDVAIELGREGVRLDPKSGQAYLALGLAHHAAGLDRDALEELRRAQMTWRDPEQRAHVAALIASLRASAPDSLRAVFTADSLAHEATPLVPDSTAVPAPAPVKRER